MAYKNNLLEYYGGGSVPYQGYQSGGGVDEETGEKSVKFYGMASSAALEKYYSDNVKIDYKASEGKLVNITYKGSLEDTLLDLLGGVRSTCTYIGAKKIKDISKCTTFVCVNNQLNNYFS